MTVPSLVQKYQERETVAKLKKMNTILNQAFTMAVKDNGSPELWGFIRSSLDENSTPEEIANSLKGRDVVIKKLVPYLKTTSVCYYSDSNSCKNNPKYRRDRYALHESISTRTWSTPVILMSDGSNIHDIYMSNTNCDSRKGNSPQLQNVCGEIFVDLNGIKPPNTQGKDVFWFRITKFGIVPGGLQNDNDVSFQNNCNRTKSVANNGYGCTAWVIYNENMDYLHCDNLSWNGKKKCK